jgi:two-component system cell cycle sensor histidine kinase/response regulator CckA
MGTPGVATTRHVLYLDDDEELVFLVTRLLRRQGYAVSGYSRPQAAIEAVRADPGGLDLMLVDRKMPLMSGMEVARAVRAIAPELPVAVVSGYVDEALAREAEAAGVRELILKDDDVAAFCATVRRQVEGVAGR